MQSVANSTNLLKVLYPGSLHIPQYEAAKVLGLMGKDTKFFGEGTKYVVVSVAPGAGGSASMATAIANQSQTREIRFSLGRRKLYEIGSLEGEAIAAARDSKGAIVDVVKHAMNRARYAYARTESRAVWSDGTGVRGVISSGSSVAGATITLTRRTDVAGFFKGMKVQLRNPATGALRAATQVEIGSIQRRAGTLTLASGNWDQIAGAATGDEIVRAGDNAAVPIGLPGWVPETEPTNGDDFLGLDRSDEDVNYASGWRVDGAGQPKQMTLIDAGAELHAAGVTIRGFKAFINPLDMRDAFKEQSSYKTIDVKTDDVNIGYSGLSLQTAIGDVVCLPEVDVPVGAFWMGDPGVCTRRSAGDVPMLLDFDGVKMFLRNPSGDDYQFRLGGYFNYENAEPGAWLAGTF